MPVSKKRKKAASATREQKRRSGSGRRQKSRDLAEMVAAYSALHEREAELIASAQKKGILDVVEDSENEAEEN